MPKVSGLRLTQANLHRLGVNLEVMVGPTLLEIGSKVQDDMQAHVRQNTRRLQGNIVVGPVERYKGRISVRIGPNREGWYARFLEFGTRFFAAFPFIRPARTRIQREVKPRLRRSLKRAVKPV